MIHFVGAGPGAVDLITIRGQKLIQSADVIIYAGSLVNPKLLDYAKEDAKIHDSARLTLEEVIDIMKDAEKKELDVVRLHTGDPSIYGAIREQMDELDKLGIAYDVTPGVSSFCGAAAALEIEYTLPGITQSVIISRMEGSTKVPEKESVENLASIGATMVFFLSAGDIKGLKDKILNAGRDPKTLCAVVYKATWDDEKKFICTLDELPNMAREHGINKTALIIVGDALSQAGYEKSRLYAADFDTEFRKAKENP